jgi:hypothetical protein
LETTAPPPTPRSRGDCLPTRLSQPRLWRWAAKHRPHSYGCWRPPTCHRPLTLLIRRPLRLMELRVVLWRPRAGTFSGHKNLWFNPHRRFLLLEEFVILFCYLVIVRTQTNAPGGHPILTGTQLYMKMCKLMNIRCLPQILIETEKKSAWSRFPMLLICLLNYIMDKGKLACHMQFWLYSLFTITITITFKVIHFLIYKGLVVFRTITAKLYEYTYNFISLFIFEYMP